MNSIITELNSSNMEKIIGFLKNGELISFPTETLYALAADATNSNAVDKIYNIKKRDLNKALPIFVADISAARTIVQFNERAEILGEKFFPGPLTLILKAQKDNIIAKNIYQQKDTLAIRIPNNFVALEIIKAINKPLIGTSANLSNQPAATSVIEVIKYFGNSIPCIIDSNESLYSVPSTIIDLSEDRPLLLREGVLSKPELELVLGEKIYYV